VSEIGIKDVLAVLGPHWNTRQVTMTRVRSRIEIILAWAAEHKYRLAGNNPARWRDGLDAFLQIDKPVKRKKPPVATPAQPDPPVLVELHGELAEIKELLKRQRQRVRNEYESGPAILRRLTELERLIRGGDLHIPPKATRRYPTGRDQ
jgi:hypothetical protein